MLAVLLRHCQHVLCDSQEPSADALHHLQPVLLRA